MQQRQLRLGDILDDYCPRERRVTNHVIVAMIGEAVKQVRCTTCDADHDFKHAKVPRQRRKTETPAALYAQVLATGPKRVTHDAPPAAAAGNHETAIHEEEPIESAEPAPQPAVVAAAMAEEAPTPDARRPGRWRTGRGCPRRGRRTDSPAAHSRVAAEDRRSASADARDSRVHHPPASRAAHQSLPRPAPRAGRRRRRRPAIPGQPVGWRRQRLRRPARQRWRDALQWRRSSAAGPWRRSGAPQRTRAQTFQVAGV